MSAAYLSGAIEFIDLRIPIPFLILSEDIVLQALFMPKPLSSLEATGTVVIR